MLAEAMLGYATLHCATLCFAVLCHAILCYIGRAGEEPLSLMGVSIRFIGMATV